jgi:hypothetical protein
MSDMLRLTEEVGGSFLEDSKVLTIAHYVDDEHDDNVVIKLHNGNGGYHSFHLTPEQLSQLGDFCVAHVETRTVTVFK